MRRTLMFIGVGILSVTACLPILLPNRLAQSAAPGPQLIITQIKITASNGQFITLYNNTNGSIDLSTVQLQYFNNYDLLKATSGKLISLSGKVPAHGYFVVADGPVQVCYQMVVDSVSLGLSSSSGMVQVGHFSSTTSPQFISILDDYVGWSKTAAAGAQTLPASTSAYLHRQPLDSQNAPNISVAGGGSWVSAQQFDGSALCGAGSPSIGSGAQLLSASSSPPSITSNQASANIPAADIGLMAPQISEILPNPAPPQPDSTDEFVELYNPNDAPFDLSGFALQSGVSTTHNFTFPSGQFILQPHEFRAFYAPQTSLTLSNDIGQVKLLDPSGNVLAQSDSYSGAKDGYGWIHADGLWQWTTLSTPNAVNIAAAPPAPKSSSQSGSTKKNSGAKTAVKGAKTAGKPAPASSTFGSAGRTITNNLHPLVLAGVGLLAVLYALYEYRHDVANAFHRLRRYRTLRRTAEQVSARQ